jgi:hypothetical protein
LVREGVEVRTLRETIEEMEATPNSKL